MGDDILGAHGDLLVLRSALEQAVEDALVPRDELFLRRYLAELIARHGLDAARWRLATAPADDVRLLAAALGIRFTKQPDGGFVHSAVITLLDAQGQVAGRTEGVLQPVAPLVDALRRPQPEGGPR